MKNLKYILSTVLIAFLWACSESEVAVDNLSKIVVKFTSNIETINKTKVADSSWTNGDQVGVFMFKTGTTFIFGDATNKRYLVTTDGVMTAYSPSDTIYYPSNEAVNVDFVSYYPYKQDLQDFIYPVDVTNQTNQSLLDLLYAANAEAKNRNKMSGNVMLQFHHQLSKVEFNIVKGADYNGDLAGLKLVLTGMNTQADFLLISDTFTNQRNLSDIVALTSSKGLTSEAIILPGVGQKRTIQFILKNNDIMTYNIPDSKNYESGQKTIYNVTITDAGVSLDGQITPWKENQDGNIVVTN